MRALLAALLASLPVTAEACLYVAPTGREASLPEPGYLVLNPSPVERFGPNTMWCQVVSGEQVGPTGEPIARGYFIVACPDGTDRPPELEATLSPDQAVLTFLGTEWKRQCPVPA